MPCDQSSTVSASGHLVAASRRCEVRQFGVGNIDPERHECSVHGAKVGTAPRLPVDARPSSRFRGRACTVRREAEPIATGGVPCCPLNWTRSSRSPAPPTAARTRSTTTLRAECPVAKVPTNSGTPAWVITKYEDVRAALADPRLSRSLTCVEGAPHGRRRDDHDARDDHLAGRLRALAAAQAGRWARSRCARSRRCAWACRRCATSCSTPSSSRARRSTSSRRCAFRCRSRSSATCSACRPRT